MTNRKRVFWATTALLTSMVATSAAFAQETTGGITGQIVDPTGSPLAGATVVAVHVPTNTSSTTMTSDDGIYAFRNLRVGGPYVVTVTSAGYPTQSTSVANIGIGDPADLDILVSGEAVASNDADLGEIVVTGIRGGRLVTSPRSTFNQSDIETLPSIARDIRDFVRTSPFATTDASNNDALSIGGQSNRANAFLVDGIRQGDDFGLNANGFPTLRSPISISTLAAVSVEVAPYNAQYGTFTGGVVNSVTKSGGNAFEGEVFYETTNQDLRGDSFAYNDFRSGEDRSVTNIRNGEFEETTWGATLSGPILKDRLFFLLNYEKFETTQPVLTGAAGSGAVNEVPGITQANVDQVRQISRDVYGFDPLDWQADELLSEDEKYFAKLDWNINDRHRANVSYQQTEGGTLSLNGSSTSSTFPSLGLLSQAFVFEQNLTTYKAQIFSEWSDRFSTEFSISRKESENISSPLAGSDFAAFQVFLEDPGPAGGPPARSIRFGPERSRHANVLTNDTDQFRLVGTYRAEGGHTFNFGYEREKLDVFNLFVQFANAEYEFATIADFQARRASSIGYQNAASNDKNDGAASFSYALNTLFAQDEWDITPSLTVNLGFRYDWYDQEDRPQANPLFRQQYGFESNANIDGISVLQPRFGFNWQATDTLTVYGGIGRFQGGSPNVWISNNFTNTGNLLGIFQCRRNGFVGQFAGGFPVCTAAELAALDNIDGLNPAQIAQDRVTASAGLGTGTINIIDPTFKTPSIWKTSLGAVKDFDLTRWGLGEGWNVRAEYIHSEVDSGIGWVDLNYERQRTGVAPDGRPTFFGTVTPAPGQTAAAAAAQTVLMLTNFDGGETDQVAVSLSKDWNEGWAEGLGFNLSYTYLDSTEQNPGTSSVALSNFRQVAVIDPNRPEVADSNYEIEHATKLNVSYSRAFFGDYLTRINVFAQRRSGLNFSYAFATNANTLFGEAITDQRALFYVPAVDGSGQVTATSDPIVRYGAAFNLADFNTYLQRTGLIEYAGGIAPRNAFKSPDVNTVDLHIEQELPAFFPGGARISAYAVVENFGNLLNDEWGVLQQQNFPFYSTDVLATNNGAFYTYNTLAQDTSSSFTSASVWQVKLGVRYKF